MWGFLSNESKERVYSKLDKLEEKLDRKFDKVERRLDEQEKHLAVYNEQLTIHIQGTAEVREQNELNRKYIDMENERLRKEIAPIREHVSTVKKVGWFLGWALGTIVSVASLVLIVLNIMGKL